ncbi:MAG: glycoside hydrolase family 18 protein [Planctomycetales bacterium]|nr:glycoside hydrolase family 18 protein [Planctomycetales bacterium]
MSESVRAQAVGQAKPNLPRPASFRVVGYVPDYRIADIDPAVGKFLTDIVYFSAEPERTGELNRQRLKAKDLKLLQEIKKQHGVSLLLCIGGWDRSKGFAPMAASAPERGRFIDEVTRFCLENRFDGADLDWEHPANDIERKNFATLLNEMKRKFAPHHLRLTAAVAGWQVHSGDDFQAVDALHLMAYDAPGQHATYEFAVSEVTRLVEKGVPPAKICLGVPFYGRSVKDPAVSLTYAEIVNKHSPAKEIDQVDGIYFNNISTIERKTKFGLSSKLGGIMVWELGQDTNNERSQDVDNKRSLLRAVHRTRESAIGNK